MGHIVFGLLGIVGSFFLLKYREKMGDMIGEAAWMQGIGGVYNLLILVSVFLFFWSVAILVGTEAFLLSPLKYLIPGLIKNEGPAGAVL